MQSIFEARVVQRSAATEIIRESALTAFKLQRGRENAIKGQVNLNEQSNIYVCA